MSDQPDPSKHSPAQHGKQDDEGTGPAHIPGVNKGEEATEHDGKERGRKDEGETGAKRPTGKSSARDSTSINPQDPIDPDSPELPPA